VRRLRAADEQISRLQPDHHAPLPLFSSSDESGLILTTGELKAQDIAEGFNG
jgi:hypothetical protein